MPMALWRPPSWPAHRAGSPGSPVILLYHSIARARSDPWGVRVRPRNFAEQMSVVRAHGHPLSLTELHAALNAGCVPPRAVAVTFDDGYADNLLAAKPIMQGHRVPGTVFVSSGYVGSAREYWWDELDRVLLTPGTLPKSLCVNIGAAQYRFEFGSDAQLSRLRAWRARGWRGWHENCPSERHRHYREFWAALRQESTDSREAALASLRQAAAAREAGRASHRCVTLEQLRELAHGGLIEIGAHTVSHPSLGAISVEHQRREIEDSKAALEEMLQQPVTSFAYPFGTRDDYVDETIELLKQAGFTRACSNFPAPVTPSVDRFQLPRRVVQDWTGREFLERLAGWFADR